MGDHVGKVVASVLAEHAPKAAEAVAHATAKARQTFLEELESYNAELLGPLVRKLRESGELPSELDKLLAEIHDPTQQVGGILTSFLVYGVVFSLANTLLQPFMQSTANTIWAANPDRPLSPADVANMVVQGYMTEAAGAAESALSGIDASRFSEMVKVTGMPPSPQDLLQMFRRSIIPQGSSAGEFPSVYAGLAEGHTKDEWIPFFQKLAYVWPSPTDFVAAAVREQVDYATAETWAGKAGLDTTTDVAGGINFFDLLFDVAGRPPGPVEAAHMAHRGIIPWSGTGPAATTFQQSIAESDLKTKWTNALQALSTYVLTNGEISHLVRQGILDATTALPYYANNGVSADLAAVLVESALVETIAAERLETKGEILSMYQNQLIDEIEATASLAAIGYSGQVATELLALADFRRTQQAFTRIVQIIGRQVVMGKLQPGNASATLLQMGVPSKAVTELVNDWQLAKQIEIPAISASQIASAVYYGVETILDGMADLQALGYTQYDAWRVLSIRLHGPANLNPGGALPPQYPVRPAGAVL